MENDNIDKFLDAQFSSVYWISSISFSDLREQSLEFQASPVDIDEEEEDKPVLDPSEDEWLEESQKIIWWLVTLQQPAQISWKEYYHFKQKALGFFI